MADPDFDDYDGYSPPRPGRYQRVINLAGAATSLALVVGLGLWGYKLAVRDVTGVPVVRAALEPMRVAPQNPGGTVADYQGLAVNDIAAEGTAAPPPDRLVLAPRPVELSLEDGAGLTAPVDAAPGTDSATAAPAPVTAAPDLAMAEEPTADLPATPLPDTDAAPLDATAPLIPEAAIDEAVTAALAEALADGTPALSELADDPSDLATLAAEPEAEAPEGAITRSPRPQRRGDGAAITAPEAAPEAAPDATPEAAPVAASATEVDPATLTAGTRLIQLGAFDTADQARDEWLRLQGKFGALLTGKSLVVEAATSGGSTFYRLRALPFESEDDARRLCTALLPDHDNCIPVTQR